MFNSWSTDVGQSEKRKRLPSVWDFILKASPLDFRRYVIAARLTELGPSVALSAAQFARGEDGSEIQHVSKTFLRVLEEKTLI